ncbi:MAG: polyphosphate kinase 1 [Planctomycetota bacterium]
MNRSDEPPALAPPPEAAREADPETHADGFLEDTFVVPDSVPPPAPAAFATSTEFLNREVQWLAFNRRVLAVALDPRTPLLERLAFLAIFNSNLDEYYQKRVGGLKRQIKAGLLTRTPDGLTAEDQLNAIRQIVLPMLTEQADCFKRDLQPKLRHEGIFLLEWDELEPAELAFCGDYFRKNLFPICTPLAVDPGHPFPFLSNLSTSLGVMLRGPKGVKRYDIAERDEDDALRFQFARVKVPVVLPQWLALPCEDGSAGGKSSGSTRFVRLMDIIRHNLDDLFEGMEIQHVEPFRVTRNADVDRDEEDAEDLLELINQELRDRRFANAVRLEVDDSPHHPMNRFLLHELRLRADDVYEMPGELDYTDLWTIHGSVSRPDLKYEPWTPTVPKRLADPEANIFEIIANGDLLVHHPYESFAASVERFINAAATDPDVVALKLTLYRTAADSPFIPALIRAAEAGKQVVCLVELKARFDEERNVALARRLEKAGIHVVYGLVGLKTHTKTAVVVRKESDGMKVYAHVGTGNYHSKTANLYTDLGLFTCDPRITQDLIEVFHFLTGRSIKKDFRHLLVAPVNMRRRFVQMIDREIEHCADWRKRGADPADPDRPRIVAKMNQLEDQHLVRKLYEASNAGVDIALHVRGFCCLRPGVPGLSENIRVSCVIGRFLEHSRIFTFHNRGQREYYIGSADWMYRNLNNRVECITPVYDKAAQAKLQTVLDTLDADRRFAWDMDGDGGYTPRKPPAEPVVGADPKTAGPATLGTHQHLMDLTRHQLTED